MKTSFIFFVGAVCILFSVLGFTCERDFEKPKPAFVFAEKLTLTPYQKKYVVNDTIWVALKTNNKLLFDTLTKTSISTDTSFLKAVLYYDKWYPAPIAAGPLCAVKTPFNNTRISQPNAHYTQVAFETDCASKNYSFRVGFVPKQSGIYSIHCDLYLDNCPTKRKRPLTEYNFTFDLADGNKDVFLSIPPESRRTEEWYTKYQIDKKRFFFLEVQ